MFCVLCNQERSKSVATLQSRYTPSKVELYRSKTTFMNKSLFSRPALASDLYLNLLVNRHIIDGPYEVRRTHTRTHTHARAHTHTQVVLEGGNGTHIFLHGENAGIATLSFNTSDSNNTFYKYSIPLYL